MVRSIQNIDQDLASLETALQKLAQDFHDAYRDYLAGLGQSAQRQLVLASYHLCTQGFPEAFLDLSFQERQDLQRKIRTLGQQVQQQLTDLAKRPYPAAIDSTQSEPHGPETDANSDDAFQESESVLIDSQINLESLSNALSEAIAPEAPQNPITPPLTPRTLAQWQSSIEDAIIEILQDISHAVNRCFQDAKILSHELPDALIEIASKADMIAESSSNTPNLLKLRVETETDSADEELPPSQITVIHMRLSEIEFANPEIMPWRTKIRELSTRLSQLHREYRRKHHEKAIAEAESAWRASWFEE